MTNWKRQDGSVIRLNDEPATVQAATELGWVAETASDEPVVTKEVKNDNRK